MKTHVSSSQLTDEELVNQIIATKNTLLFGVLYDRYVHKVYNKCYGFSKTSEEAEDLTQDIFVKLYTKLKLYKPKAKFSSWLYAFTYNHCVNYVNRDTSKKIEKKAIQINDYDHEIIETEDFNLFQLKVDKLQKALEILNPEDKMILLLKYQDDLPIKEIQNVLNAGESAIKMRLKRAKAKVIEIYNYL